METRSGARVLVLAMAAIVSIDAGARILTGPGDAVIAADEPLSFVDESITLGGTAVTLYEGCLATTNVTVFRNVELSDITNLTALAGSAWHTGKRGRWLATTMCFLTTKSDGALECELQAQGSNLFGCHLHLEQSGDDVVARILRAADRL